MFKAGREVTAINKTTWNIRRLPSFLMCYLSLSVTGFGEHLTEQNNTMDFSQFNFNYERGRVRPKFCL